MKDETIHQPQNQPPVTRFLGQRESIFLFLALLAALTILLVVFIQPTSLTQYTSQHTRLYPLGQISLCFTVGFFVTTLSRALLYFAHTRGKMQLAGYIIWLITELLVCVSVMTLVSWALGGAGPVKLAPLAGDLALGLVSLEVVPYTISFLVFRLGETKRDNAELRKLLEMQSKNPKTPNDATINFFTKGNHLALSTKQSNVLYIESANNYVNIHYINDNKEDSMIVLNSMRNIEQSLEGTSFLRCHRGYMVNVENVRLMRKESMGLVLELNHTQKVIPVSKSYAEPITHYFAYNTNMVLPNE